MKTAIESIAEVYVAGKEHPGLYDDIKVPNRILLAAIVQLAQDLEDLKKSTPVSSSYQEEIPEKCLTLTALQQQVYRCLLGTSLDQHHERALKIYRLIQSL